MTNNPDLLAQLRRAWPREGRGAASRDAVDDLRRRRPDLALDGLEDLCDVVGALETRGGRTVLERARIVEGLLEDARNDLVRRALLQTLLPGVVSVCRQLRFGDGIVADPGETLAVACGLLSELLVDWAGQSRPYAAPDLLSALRGRLRRWLLKEKAALRAVAPGDVDERGVEGSSLETRIESLRGGRHDRLARLTYARVFEGRTLGELAAQDHCAPGSLRAELQHFAVRYLL
jgi:hypothetical protein